jgi:hypothetical protein
MCPLFLSDFLIALEFSEQIFKKYSDNNFSEYLSSGSRVVTWGRTDTHDGANAPKTAELYIDSWYNDH